MAYAEKRGRGSRIYYIARYSDGQGKWPSVKGADGKAVRYKTKREAKKAAEDAEADVRGGRWQAPNAGKETFGQWANVWYSRQDLASRTMGNYRSALETSLLPYFQDDPLVDISPDTVGKWERHMRSQGYKPDTIRTYRGVLSVVLADAAAPPENKIDFNPVPKPRGRGRRAGKARHRAPEKPIVDPLGALLIAERCAVLSGRDDEFVLVIALSYTGARWAELVGLERPYLRGTVLRIEQQLEELDDGTWERCAPKDDSRRDVDLPDFLAALLAQQASATRAPREELCSCYRPTKDTPAHPGGAHVFTGRINRRRDPRNALVPVRAPHWRRSGFESMIFKPAAEGWYPPKAPRPRRPVPVLAGPFPGIPVRGRNYIERSTACWLPIAEGLTPHLLRHSHKTWINEDRIDAKLSHERFGHEMGGMGARYSHVTDSMRSELCEALTARWEAALDARLKISASSPVAVLDELLRDRATRHARVGDDQNFMIVPQNSHRRVPVGLRSRPAKRVSPGVELRGFEPLTPSMRTRCATGLRYSPKDSVRLANIGTCSRTGYSPTARRSSAYWSKTSSAGTSSMTSAGSAVSAGSVGWAARRAASRALARASAAAWARAASMPTATRSSARCPASRTTGGRTAHHGATPVAVRTMVVIASRDRPAVRRRRRAMTAARPGRAGRAPWSGWGGSGASSRVSGGVVSAVGSSARLWRRRVIPASVSRRSHMGTRTTAQTATIARYRTALLTGSPPFPGHA